MKLHLVLKAKWYDMVVSGEKPCEYREKTPYWKKRIWDRREEIESVVLHRAYTNITHEEKIKQITESYGVEKWGAVPGVEYYTIEYKR